MRRGRDVVGNNLGDPGYRTENDIELLGVMVELRIGDVEAGQVREMRNFRSSDCCHECSLGTGSDSLARGGR